MTTTTTTMTTTFDFEDNPDDGDDDDDDDDGDDKIGKDSLAVSRLSLSLSLPAHDSVDRGKLPGPICFVTTQ